MKKIFALITLLILTSCATHPRANPERDQKFKAAYKQIGTQCKLDRQNKIYKTRLEMVQKCSKPKVMKLANQMKMPNKDLIGAQVAESESLARKLDNKEITQEEADKEYSNFMLRITEEENRRSAKK